MRSVERKVLGAVKHSVHSLPGTEAVVGIAPGLLFRGGIILVQICDRDLEGSDCSKQVCS